MNERDIIITVILVQNVNFNCVNIYFGKMCKCMSILGIKLILLTVFDRKKQTIYK